MKHQSFTILRNQANQLEKEAMFAEMRGEHVTASAKQAQANAIRATIKAGPPPSPIVPRKPRAAPSQTATRRRDDGNALSLCQLTGVSRSVNRQLNDDPDM